MSITKNLGGDRLGSGNKMNVHMHGYERSTFETGYIWRSTMSAGTLVPFLKEVALPGDTFDIDLDAFVNTHPTIGPLFGSFKMQLDVFQAPIRLYQAMLHNNKIGIGMRMADVKLPVMAVSSSPAPDPLTYGVGEMDIDNLNINASCIHSYLGLRGAGLSTALEPPESRLFNGIPLLAYWEIVKQYYSNKMEEDAYVIHRPKDVYVYTIIDAEITTLTGTDTVPESTAGTITKVVTPGTWMKIDYTGTLDPNMLQIDTSDGPFRASELFNNNYIQSVGVFILSEPNWSVFNTFTAVNSWSYPDPNTVPQTSPPRLQSFPLENIDIMRERILQHVGPTAFNINVADLAPYRYLLDADGDYHSRLANQEGLAVKTYQSDLFNNWLNTDWIDGPNGISAITAIDTTGGSFNIDTLLLSRKVYDMLNRIAVSGGSYDDWTEVNWDHKPFTRAESPIYHGGLIKEVVFQEIISQNGNSSANGGDQPLGTLAGKGTLSGKHKGGHIRIKVDELSYIIAIVSLTPRLDYSQGNKWDVNLKTMDDFHKPALDQIGFQELITEQMAWWSTDVVDSTTIIQHSAGKQPAWVNYMTNVNEVRGNFAVRNSQMFMVLNRKYGYAISAGAGHITDLTTYIDPSKYNHVFAQTSLDAQNFWVQLGIDMKVRRKMSSKLIPNL